MKPFGEVFTMTVRQLDNFFSFSLSNSGKEGAKGGRCPDRQVYTVASPGKYGRCVEGVSRVMVLASGFTGAKVADSLHTCPYMEVCGCCMASVLYQCLSSVQQ